MNTVLQIVPRLPPATSGVGDYALLLAQQWRSRFALESIFLVTDPDWIGGSSVEGFKVRRLVRRSAANFVQTLAAMNEQATPIFLHYVGYAYARRGAPVWLAKGMRTWLQVHPQCRTGIFFHELFAFGPPWTSAFWLNPIQRWVCRELACAVRFRFTNRTTSAKVLDGMAACSTHHTQVLPVFSNLGEPQCVSPLSARLPQMVVYGHVTRSKGQRVAAMRQLSGAVERLGLERVVSFGPTPWSQQGLDVPVENRGVLSASEVSALLGAARVGYLDYSIQFVAKSGIFAAYCAHGLVPILLNSNAKSMDGLCENRHFLKLASFTSDLAPRGGLQEIAQNAKQWYHGHSIAITANSIAARFLV